MCKYPLEQLLKDRRVIEEIERHRWFEGEKQGKDIGFQPAAQDWYDRYANEWLRYHQPNLPTP